MVDEPEYGYLEDVTPREGYEKVVGRRTTSFTYEQLASNRISYVQSNHSGIEPVSDHFSVYVTDGIHESAEVCYELARARA